MMRTSTLAVAPFATLLALVGCDAEDASQIADDPVSFRCVGTGCVQSPYLGGFDISNLSELVNVNAASPDGAATVRWVGLKKGSQTYTELRVTDLAECQVRRHTADWEPCEGTIIELRITRGSLVKSAAIKIESRETITGGALDVHQYEVLGNLDPLTGVESKTFSFPVCPLDEEGTRRLVMLPDVRTNWTVNDDDGLGELATAGSTSFTLACTGYAEAKGYTRSRVLPATGGARNYGIASYNGYIHAMRALYRNPGTTAEYSALTEHGTAISILDLTHNPPLFNELDQSPPFTGFGVYLLESVYNGDPLLQGGRKGATCKKAYPGYPCSGQGQTDFPGGMHRLLDYRPPLTVVDGWASMPDCDVNDLDASGSVAVYIWTQGQCVSPY